jgi:hypothetical protein
MWQHCACQTHSCHSTHQATHLQKVPLVWMPTKPLDHGNRVETSAVVTRFPLPSAVHHPFRIVAEIAPASGCTCSVRTMPKPGHQTPSPSQARKTVHGNPLQPSTRAAPCIVHNGMEGWSNTPRHCRQLATALHARYCAALPRSYRVGLNRSHNPQIQFTKGGCGIKVRPPDGSLFLPSACGIKFVQAVVRRPLHNSHLPCKAQPTSSGDDRNNSKLPAPSLSFKVPVVSQENSEPNGAAS